MIVILAFGFYVAYEKGVFKRHEDVGIVDMIPPQPAPPTSPPPVTSGKFRNGSFTGNVADAFYGPLQVKAVISGGKIVDVVFLQYPNDVPTSKEVSAFAIPALKSDAIKKQSAQVDIVSGATQTAEAFRITMGAALSQAQ